MGNINALAVVNKQTEGIRSFTSNIGSLDPQWKLVERSGVSKNVIEGFNHEGRLYGMTPRFLSSVCSRFGFGPSVFRYFTPNEVFDRIREVRKDAVVRVTVDDQAEKALAVSNPTESIVTADGAYQVLRNAGTKIIEARYGHGVITTTHQMKDSWSVNGDTFGQTFTLETPVDGYGPPNIYLSLMRMICTNGLIGYAPAFKSEIQLGKARDDAMIPLARAIDSFNNEEGFMSLRQRLEAAQNSLASLYEVETMSERLHKAMGVNPDTVIMGAEEFNELGADLRRELGAVVAVFRALYDVTGRPSEKYHVANVRQVPVKKQRLLPMNCTVYDLFNVATELTTHHKELVKQPNQLHAWVGSMVSNEYDLEGSCEGKVYQPKSFYLQIEKN